MFFDTHAHLDFPDFAADLPQVIARAQAAGITKIICIGTDVDSSRQAIHLAEQYPCVLAAVGWHPGHVTAAPADVRPALRALARHPKVVAIGETGLDYYRLPSTQNAGSPADDARYKERQAALFEQHLEVAAESGLNCVIHQRGDCLADTLALLTPYADRVRGVFHCFAGDVDNMRRVLALNSIVSFTGIVTFKNAQSVRDTVAATPLGQFMLETDSPYLAPVPHRGKRCEPAYVKEIAEVVAKVKGCTREELSAATCETAGNFFHGLGEGGRR
ncbi:MAG: TatD family hydrolase [Verrucomicrobiae bacterium]|nr:TatD family hydrolase [Verrucomicrobiae bacterium]